MIPLRLHLQNFLSYGDSGAPIDFDGVHVACLCGPNGHGKSSLLDAITWSLWGQARSNTADDLVRLGQTSMLVDFEFQVDGQHYRVTRRRTKGRNSQSDLQFQVREPDGDWRALTGQGVRGTQERINQVLRMDYETFINSAFILQGRADEFARKTPGDRKKILGEILNLGQYDQLSEAARARRAEARMRVNSLEADLQRMEAEQRRLPELQGQVERLTQQHTQAELTVERARLELQQILLEKARLDEHRRLRDDLDRRLAGAEARLKSDRQLLAAAQAKQAQAETLVKRAKEIRGRAQEYYALCTERDGLTAAASQLRVLERDRELVQRRIREAEFTLQSRLQLVRQRVRELNAKQEQLPKMREQVVDLERQAAGLDRLQEQHAAHQLRLQEIAARRAEAASDQKRAEEELGKVDERFQTLKVARAQCPICEGPLPEEKRMELGRQLREQKTALKEAQGAAIQKEADARRADEETRKTLQELDRKLKTGQHMRDRLAQARQTMLELEAATQDFTTELEVVAELEQQLERATFAAEDREQFAGLDQQIRALNFDERRAASIAKRLQELGAAERDLHSLEQAEAALPEQQQQVQTLEAAIRTQEEALADDRAARVQAEKELGRTGAVEAEVRKRDETLIQAERGEAALAKQLGAAQEALQQCEALAAQITERRGERESAARDEAIYEELTKAFGRNGIQALIIENALPEIETEANLLLARMTDGGLSVRLNSQKELKSGGQAETLEIEISDGMGPRRYELFSGGEAFRVNFAIRIALSKLLARRAGARLETLVIDEGFGSQDEEGRMRIVEAIHAVQTDFARILVITHLDELKEAFPTRIEVTKGVSGSQVAIY